jgi:ribosomal protein L44E
MKQITESRFCENCGRETLHSISEDALEIEYECKECHKHEDIIKSFF